MAHARLKRAQLRSKMTKWLSGYISGPIPNMGRGGEGHYRSGMTHFRSESVRYRLKRVT